MLQPALRPTILTEDEQTMTPSDAIPRLIAFLRHCDERTRFIARHVQLLGYCDLFPESEVGLRERVAYILTEGCRANAPAACWTVESAARKRRLETREAASLAEAFEALSLTDWKTLIDACAISPDAAHALAARWQRLLDHATAGSSPADARVPVLQGSPRRPSAA